MGSLSERGQNSRQNSAPPTAGGTGAPIACSEEIFEITSALLYPAYTFAYFCFKPLPSRRLTRLSPCHKEVMAEGSNGGDGTAARGRWNALAENSRQRRPKGVEGTVRFRTSFHNVVYDVFRARAWKETDSDVDWDVCWADTGAPRQATPPVHLTPHLLHRASCTVHRAPYSLHLTSHRVDPPCTAHTPPATRHLPPTTYHHPVPAQGGSARTSTTSG